MKHRDFQCRICHVICVLSPSTIDVCSKCQDTYGFTNLIDKQQAKLDKAIAALEEIQSRLIYMYNNSQSEDTKDRYIAIYKCARQCLEEINNKE
jgi:erythromycin esterase-like protein